MSSEEPRSPSHPALGVHHHSEHHHRNVQGGTPRAAVFGLSDGLVSNIALVLGVAGASPAPAVVRLAGIVGLLGGAFSMAAGEYVSMKAQAELLSAELEMERVEIARRPEVERRELAQIYRGRGVAPDLADKLAAEMMSDPELALQTHAREELGIDPAELGRPVPASITSFVTFAGGALVPLLPWFVTSGLTAVVASVILGAFGAIALGSALSRFTRRSPLLGAVRQLVITAFAAGVPYGLGALLGATSQV